MIEIIQKNNKYFADENFNTLFTKGFGINIDKKIYELNEFEVQYLLENNNITIKKAPIEKKTFQIKKYLVYKELRSKGYLLKTAFKYGFDFRVYEQGILNKHEHSKWLLNILDEKDSLNLKDLQAKSRISHSTKKKIIFAIVDMENSITYIESSWKKF